MFSEIGGHSGLVSASIFPRKSRVKERALSVSVGQPCGLTTSNHLKPFSPATLWQRVLGRLRPAPCRGHLSTLLACFSPWTSGITMEATPGNRRNPQMQRSQCPMVPLMNNGRQKLINKMPTPFIFLMDGSERHIGRCPGRFWGTQ